MNKIKLFFLHKMMEKGRKADAGQLLWHMAGFSPYEARDLYERVS